MLTNERRVPFQLRFVVQAKGLGIRLATPSPADAEAARGVKYRSRHKGFRTGEKAKMAAITGESIFGSGKESSAQGRQKAILVKAAKLGIKTRGMRLLEPDVSNATRRLHVPSRGIEESTYSHRMRSPPRPETNKRKRQAGTGGGLEDARRVEHGVIADVGLSGDGGAGCTAALAVGVGDERDAMTSLSKKQRKRRSSRPASSAVAAGGKGGLAAIANLY